MPDVARIARRAGRRWQRAWLDGAGRLARVRDRIPDTGAVALTFDDGPDPQFTPAVLDTLDALGVRATFFVVGANAEEHPQLVQRMVADGHAVGSHSARHPEPWTVSTARLRAEYRDGRAATERAAGTTVERFRPPKGWLDGRGAVVIRSLGLRPWLWSLDLEDWRPGTTTADILARAEPMAGGDVVLLHDAIEGPLDARALDRGATVEAVRGLVELARARGLRVAPLPA